MERPFGRSDSCFHERPPGKPITVAVAHELEVINQPQPQFRRARRTGAESTLVEPREAGAISNHAARLAGRRPIGGAVAVAVAGYLILAVLISALGLLLTKSLLQVGGIASADSWLPELFARHRSSTWNDVSAVASRIGDVPVLPALVVTLLIVAYRVRRLRIGMFLTAAILMEVTLYRIGAMAAPRVRPDVVRLDQLPVDESFPSGHAAASVVVYVGLALIISSWTRRAWVRVFVWCAAPVAVLAVAVSRLYRGMHHPADVVSGFLLGAGCLAVALVAVRVYGHLCEHRRRGSAATRHIGGNK